MVPTPKSAEPVKPPKVLSLRISELSRALSELGRTFESQLQELPQPVECVAEYPTESHAPRHEPPTIDVPQDLQNPSNQAEDTDGISPRNLHPEKKDLPKADASADGSEDLEYSTHREIAKSFACLVFVLVIWVCIFMWLLISGRDFAEPDCEYFSDRDKQPRSCDMCGESTLLLPLLGEYEQSWDKGLRAILYFVGLIFIFMGMSIYCDQFVAAIETITSTERVVWGQVHEGTRAKFHHKIWNPTFANLTLMAFGSSAPEILLSITELYGNNMFAGRLGPSTIVGSASFNLFVISAVCVSAIPAPQIRKVDGMGVFNVTSSVSLFAYLWLLLILLVCSPEKIDIWEGVATLLLFPIFLLMAFAADKGWICKRRCSCLIQDSFSVGDRISITKSVGGPLAKLLPTDTVKLLMKEYESKLQRGLKRSHLRKNATRIFTGIRMGVKKPNQDGAAQGRRGSIDGNTKVTIGFTEEKYVVPENIGFMTLKVVASSAPSGTVQVRYFTRPGTAKANERYLHTEGVLLFMPGVVQREVSVQLVDNNDWEPDEEFFVELEEVHPSESSQRRLSECSDTTSRHSAGSSSSVRDKLVSIRESMQANGIRSSSGIKTEVMIGTRTAKVTILNDDVPGCLGFDVDQLYTERGVTATIGISRTKGNAGAIACEYQTGDLTAKESIDYTPVAGTLHFEDGETHQFIKVPIPSKPGGDPDAPVAFSITLSSASPGVTFHRILPVRDSKVTVEEEEDDNSTAVCCVTIAAPEEPVSFMSRCCGSCFNREEWRSGLEMWAELAHEAFFCNGSIDEQATSGVTDWLFHMICLPWKIIAMMVPPADLANGWPCFFSALAIIGVTTALAGDIATLLGCCLDISDEITASILVALGTSLPDTLASRSAAQQDDTADNAIGNITGSNTVNVFLGLGIAWTIGAVYWEDKGPTQRWRTQQYGGENFEMRFLHRYPRGGFFVPAGSILASQVAFYTVCALICLAFFRCRRRWYGGELGGPQFAQSSGSIALFCLWIAYLAATILTSA